MSGTVTLQIYLLGKFQVLRDGNAIPPEAFVTKKAILLLKILLTAHPRPVTKDQFLEWLWPDVEPAVGAKSLRAVTSRLRRALEPNLPRYASSSFIQVSGGRYRFQHGSDTWLDVTLFEAAVAEGKEQAAQDNRLAAVKAYREARQLYRGDYLEEDRYEDWAMVERERLREMYLDVTSRLAGIFAQQGRYRQAIALCREVLTADSLRESVWRQLMRYNFYADDPALALRAYKACKQALAQELTVEPDPETTALYNEIKLYQQINISAEVDKFTTLKVEHSQNLPLILGRMPFVGRQKEFVWLLDQLNLATTERSRLVLIEGETGIGKTRLAEEVLAFARQQNVTVLIGQCREQYRHQPYWPIREVLAEII